jgi:uncharacterized membrane protein (UPF0127 family)
MKISQIINNDHPEIKISVNWCDSFISKFKGLMFVPYIEKFTGIILAENNESKLNTAIHMLFMNFDITTVWISADKKVVDVKLAKKWHLSYFPKTPAQYVLETHTDHLQDFHIGDQLIFVNEK